MPTSVGPNTFGEENLVFAFDTGDTVNSYKGRPTTNRLSQNGVDGFDLTVASTWGGGDSSFITYDSTVVTPYGNTGATKITALSGSNNHHLFSKNSWSEGGDSGYTMQALVKPIQLSNRITFGLYNDGSNRVGIDLNSNTIYYGAGISNRTAKIRYVEDGWYYLEANVEGRNGGWVPSFGIGDENGNPDNWTPTEDQSIYVAAVQFEQGQSVASPFVNGTRSATEGLKDLTGNSTIDLTNVSFDSNAEIEFDGTNDYLLTGLDTPQNPLTVSIWFKQYNTQGRAHLLGNYRSDLLLGVNFSTNNRKILWYMYDSAVYGFGNIGIYGTEYSLNVWNNVVYWNDGSEYRVYLNGELKASTVDSGWAQVPDLSIGANHSYNNDFFDGKVDAVRIYNRALTASEIKSNFNAIKGRFNI